jgi:hypothetical protein
VLYRPTNDPDLLNDVLWANDLGDEENRRLAQLVERPGFRLEWDDSCQVRLEPLDQQP